jgi:hypothetical protein
MFRFDAARPVTFDDGFSRRDFLHAGSLSTLGLSLPAFLNLREQGAVSASKDMNCIMLFLLGGPSHLDTWDLKPDAPAKIRSPFKPIKTNVPGIEISEIFPGLARQMDKVALVHGCYHEAAALHDTGHQLMQTGKLFENGPEHPHMGCVVQRLKGSRGADVPAHILLPQPMGNTGGNLPHGQNAGFLGREFDPLTVNADPSSSGFNAPAQYISALRTDSTNQLRKLVDGSVNHLESRHDARLADEHFHQAFTLMSSAKMREAFDLTKEPETVRDKYGRNRFGQSCLLSRRLIERGVRFVTVNMFETVFNEITWDMHGTAPFSTMENYRDHVGPMFDHAYATLLEDLRQRGLLSNTLVMATGEFGRTPEINPAGGRDHWPHCWTTLFAGGGVKGGQRIGASDEIGAYPRDRPVKPEEIVATAYHALGIDLNTAIGSDGDSPVKVVAPETRPVSELF